MKSGKVGKMSGCALVFTIMLLLWAGNAPAASFDCAKAGTAVEKMICADAELSKLDEEMATVYKPIDPRIADPEASFNEITAAYKQMDPYIADPVGYRMEQRQWLKSRNACKDAVCVRQAYQTRLAALRSLSQGPKPCFRLLERKWPEVSSGHYPVCVDLLKSMNKLCAEMPLCEWKVASSVTSLSLPRWEELDPREHLKLIQHIYQPSRTFDAPEEQWFPLRPDVLRNIQEGKACLWRTLIDVDRDGEKEYVVRFHPNPCKNGIDFYGTESRIAVTDASMSRVDLRYSGLIGMDIMFHDNRAFIIRRSDLNGGKSFYVGEPFFTASGSGKNSVCVFDYLQ